MKLLIGADLVPTTSNAELFAGGDAKALVGRELLDILRSADYRIFNLETPLTDVLSPIEKCGPALAAPTKAINGYKALGVDCVTIANNHIMDQGENGFLSTLKTMDESEISYFGGGLNLEEAQKPFVIELEGKKIGFYACAEHEFSIAEEAKMGANPFDPLESLDHISELKPLCDYVIVLYHGGKEHYRYPSPNLQKVCRKMVQKGANLVVCQHSHCVGCEEKYQDGTIVYGQGNFLFDHSESEFWKTSLLISIEIESGKIDYIPLSKKGNGVRLADENEKKIILAGFESRSESIKSNEFIKKEYEKFAFQMRNSYLIKLDSMSIVFKALNKLCRHKLKYKVSKKRKLAIRNYVECEAHRELFLYGLMGDRGESECE